MKFFSAIVFKRAVLSGKYKNRTRLYSLPLEYTDSFNNDLILSVSRVHLILSIETALRYLTKAKTPLTSLKHKKNPPTVTGK